MPSVETVAQTGSASANAQTLPKELQNMKSPGILGVEREFTWDEVRQIVAAERLDLLGRTAEKERIYSEYMDQLRKEYGSVAAYVLQTKLASFIADSSREYLIIPNDFPYALEPDMSHFIVWSKLKLTGGIVPDPFIKQMIGAYLDELIGEGEYEWTWFVNPPHLQSIPDAAHGHLIVKTL
ncbi:hypothetical protein GGH94_006120 [Coemansia aciculifera]|uniref:Uncharacterized protein n=2 Tax=Coemansia TaxID=4863 RepID=A0A9W8LA73_9FUNG|nr:hypothetical protein GGI19_004574 [Coemansia pectinata]KAJ2859405.1 hypothetical protein GGH94_006120 [Coemansia aciculifera]KAJ2869223.1 hypothetical protein GGH93_006228 [Coemansia aciculifera]KAJ2881289.1 hypothetical protein H4R27_004181 [Coemansia aciculifera]